jgi:hypothetical protein
MVLKKTSIAAMLFSGMAAIKEGKRYELIKPVYG